MVCRIQEEGHWEQRTQRGNIGEMTGRLMSNRILCFRPIMNRNRFEVKPSEITLRRRRICFSGRFQGGPWWQENNAKNNSSVMNCLKWLIGIHLSLRPPFHSSVSFSSVCDFVANATGGAARGVSLPFLMTTTPNNSKGPWSTHQGDRFFSSVGGPSQWATGRQYWE